ncbi:MAG: metal-sensitive transcriptional regulator [Anaerolineae bacterium]|nr:metal-sensitive transcriptional regulator [Anaerolineae bacterium]
MDDRVRSDAVQRLKSVSGHINGIVRMLEDDRYCIDVIKQIQAVQAALNRVNESILDSHLRTCVTTAVQGDNAEERERVLDEVTEVFRYTNKLTF